MVRCAALLLGSLIVTACTTQVIPTPASTPASTPAATPAQTPTQTPVATPDAPAFVLRMETYGGLQYPGDTVELPPDFTLYPDGLAIYSVYLARGVELHQARYSPEQIDALVDSALNEGGIAEAACCYQVAPVADDGTTRFEIHANGVDKVVSVYALGWEEGVTDVAIRRKLQALAERLRGIVGDTAAGRIEDLGLYKPTAYRLTLDSPIPSMNLAGRPWPWPDKDLDDFPRDSEGALVISAAEAQLIADPPMSAPNDVILAGPNGTGRYLVRIRALLPDQVP